MAFGRRFSHNRVLVHRRRHRHHRHRNIWKGVLNRSTRQQTRRFLNQRYHQRRFQNQRYLFPRLNRSHALRRRSAGATISRCLTLLQPTRRTKVRGPKRRRSVLRIWSAYSRLQNPMLNNFRSRTRSPSSTCRSRSPSRNGLLYTMNSESVGHPIGSRNAILRTHRRMFVCLHASHAVMQWGLWWHRPTNHP